MRKQLTLQTTIATAIFIIGILGIALVISTDIIYRQLAFEQQQTSLQKLLLYKTADLLETLRNRQIELGLRLQGDDAFLAAYNNHDSAKITELLNLEFDRYFVTTGLIKLEKILVFDPAFNLVSQSSHGIDTTGKTTLPCPELPNRLKAAPPRERLKAHSALCRYKQQVYYSTMVSIGSIHSSGVIQIITDTAHMLAQIEDELGIPIKLTTPDRQLIYRSANWPDNNDGSRYISGDYTIKSPRGEPMLTVSASADIRNFIEEISTTRQHVILAASLFTLLTLFISLFILHRGLKPLKKLQKAAESSAKGTFIAAENNSSYREISTPIHAFNRMIETIQSLIHNLNNEVEKHEITENNFRLAKENAEKIARKAEQQSRFLQMTLQSIVDGVITTSIDGYVKSINPMAAQLTGWTQQEALGKPLVQVLHALSEDTLKRIYNPTENIEYKTVLDEPVSAILIQRHTQIETPVEYITAPMRDSNNNIAGIVVIIHDESVQRTLNRQLTFQATHDALTGLINRYEFERRLKDIITSPSLPRTSNTLCYIDLDQFKLVNDTCGHTAGDELLKKITLLLQNHIKDNGTLARLGGDEFGLLLEGHDTQDALAVAQELLKLIQQFHFSWNNNNFTIGASIGITEITLETRSCEEVLSNADSACYLAKESGRNRVQIFTAEDDKMLTQQREMHWVSRINLAMEENRFQLYFQEIRPLQGHEKSFILHGEILLRMIDKEGDIVSPGHFLPAAERYNLIGMIDQWVVEHTLQWLASRKEKVLVSVNLSGKSLSNHDFLNFVVTKIKRYNINPELLCFEITETAAISHLNTAIHFMTVLKKLGCAFALDDFGSGLSSFSYLTSLPVDYLKIDGAFVMDIDKDPMHYAMVKSINEVGQVMGISTIAEFAASENIIQCLSDIGVDNAQGYAISRPTPLASLNPAGNRAHLSLVKPGNHPGQAS